MCGSPHAACSVLSVVPQHSHVHCRDFSHNYVKSKKTYMHKIHVLMLLVRWCCQNFNSRFELDIIFSK